MMHRKRRREVNPSGGEYLAHEKGTIVKKWHGKTPVCAVYPNSYFTGMSNLAIHILYRTLNSDPGVVCERCFLDDKETRSLESGRPLSLFKLIFLTLSFELDYVNIPKLLRTSGIPVLASERREKDPIVVAGGICVMANPEPISRFIDLFVLGDIEATVPSFIRRYHEIGKEKRQTLIDELSCFDWVYNPTHLEVSYGLDGTIESFRPEDFSATIELSKNKDLGASVIISEKTEFSGMFLAEGSRGCPSRCLFCLLGNIYPFRCDPLEKIASETRDVGIIGGGVSFHPRLTQIVKDMKKKGRHVHLPSLRVDEVGTDLIKVIHDEVKTLTFGIEAGSERLRRFIGKPIPDSAIYEKLEAILDVKPFNLKLYFMIGLYGEEKTDLEDILTMVKRVHHIMVKTGAPKGRMGSLTVHVSPFVPKAATPFQWLPMAEMDELKEKLAWLKHGVSRVGNTYFTHESIKYSMIQGILARGDRRTGEAILRFAGGGNLSTVLRESPLNLNFFVHRERARKELFPWDFIRGQQKKEGLWRRLKAQLKSAQREQALQRQPSSH